MYRILIPEDIAESGKQYLLERGYELQVGLPGGWETLKQEIAQSDGLIVRNAKYPREVFEHAERLKVIGRHGTGTDNIAVKAAEELGIWVVNGPTANIHAVAEFTIAMMLSLSCRLRELDAYTRVQDWSFRLSMERHELAGRTLGIIGFGNIGRLVAKKAAAGFEMKVIAYDTRETHSETAGVIVTQDFNQVLAEADILSLHIPSTENTRGMFNYEMFSRMKRGSFFINCARGDLYVEEDLARALEEGHIAGAALDVYASEPLGESRLYRLKQVLLSQHSAGLSEESKEKMSLYAAQGVDQVLRGETPRWPVNHPRKTRVKERKL